jgi:para-nitrobenzyl esterase
MAKAIIQSGGGIGARGIAAFGEVPQAVYDAQGKELMDAGGLTDLGTMRAASARRIFDIAQEHGRRMLTPHNDGKVITEGFDEAFFDGSIAQVPVMIGYNKDDMGGLGGEAVDRFCALRDSLGCPVHEYEFLREPPTDEAHPASAAGAFHSAELWYMFGTLKNSWRPFTEADRKLSEETLDAWTSFCRTGDPGWPAYKHDQPYKKLFDVK